MRSRRSRAPVAPRFDFDDEQAPFALKLDMARQCWDESRHVEISVKLGDWMGTEIGEYSEATFLYEAACAPDPILRLCGVNRALEGLAIDVFNTMKEFGDLSGDPVLEFCEDWMLADEVTHVKMGSDWLRRLTADDPERRERALDFQRTVDKLFSLGGFRGETDENPIQLARKLRADGRLLDRRDRRARRDRAAGQGRRGGDGRGRRLVTAEPDVSEITLVPAEFTLVKFDAGEVRDLIAAAIVDTGFPTDTDVRVEVDEVLPHPLTASVGRDRRRHRRACGSPAAASRARSARPVSRPTTPRSSSPRRCSGPRTGSSGGSRRRPPTTRSPTGSARSGTPTPRPRTAALGYPVRVQRRRYVFRLYGGFNDVADAEFDRLGPAARSTGPSSKATARAWPRPTPGPRQEVDPARDACARRRVLTGP